MARRLAALGVGPGGRVATTLPPSLAFCELLHGAWRAGAAVVPLNTRLPKAEQAAQARTARADATIAEPVWNGFEAEIGPPPDADAVAAVLFTSGTSGEPKPVELTFGNLDASAAASAGVLGTEPDDRWLCVLPLFHVAGLAILVRAARAAATVELRERPDDLTEATLLSLVPTQLRRLLDGEGFDAPRLRALLLGGGAVPPELLEEARRYGIPARCTYGMTETASQVVVTEPWEAAGRPLPGAEIEIAADGEILISGPMAAPATLADDGRIHTGDIGYFDRSGRLQVQGRLKELIITGGENVAPVAVEAVVLAHPSVGDAGVAGVPDREWGEAVTAFIVEREPVSDYELDAFCRERLAGYQVPKRFVRVESLPRNAGGKLLRLELRHQAPSTKH
jgi:O-succinylbenzoic acid--CoA ligase